MPAELTGSGKRDVPTLLRRAVELLAIADRCLRSGIRFDPDSEVQTMILSFASKQYEHLVSVQVLVRAGQHRDAILIARTMAEGMTQLLWAVNGQPRTPKLWHDFGVIEDWRAVRDLLGKGQLDGIYPSEVDRWLESKGQEFLSDKARRRKAEGKPLPADPYRRVWHGIDIASMFDSVQGTDLYERFYRGSSGWAHWNPRSIAMALDFEGDQMTGYRRKDSNVAAQALMIGIQSLFQSLEVLTMTLNAPNAEDLTCFYESLTAQEAGA